MAAVQVSIPDEIDIVPIAAESLGIPERLANWNIGIGDEVHAVGLFSEAPGHQTNMPIVRVGNIPMMPTEQIQTDMGYADVYLVEARSLGGMSGSPVFVKRHSARSFGHKMVKLPMVSFLVRVKLS